MGKPVPGDRTPRYDNLATNWTRDMPWPMSRLAQRLPDVVEEDLECRHCAYNLRTIPTAGRCPECGKPVRHSLSNTNGNQRLNRVWFGIVVLMVIEVCWFVYWGGFALLYRASNFSVPTIRDGLIAVDVIYLVALVVACLLTRVAAVSQHLPVRQGALPWLGGIGAVWLLLLLADQLLPLPSSPALHVSLRASLQTQAAADLVIAVIAVGLYPLVTRHTRPLVKWMKFWIAQLPVIAALTLGLVLLILASHGGDAPAMLLFGMHAVTKLLGLCCLYGLAQGLSRRSRRPATAGDRKRGA